MLDRYMIKRIKVKQNTTNGVKKSYCAKYEKLGANTYFALWCL